jgi:hypothetical protein
MPITHQLPHLGPRRVPPAVKGTCLAMVHEGVDFSTGCGPTLRGVGCSSVESALPHLTFASVDGISRPWGAGKISGSPSLQCWPVLWP